MIQPNNRPAEPLIESLSRREQEILGLLAQGNTAPEIAERLTLAVSSVKWYLQQIYGKFGVNSKRQAIVRARELGLLEPTPVTVVAAVASAAPTPPAPERKHNLPVQVTRFFGREEEIRNLIQRLSEYRLVTLTGSGGVGKTRLSLQAAEALVDKYADGVWLVELAPLNDAALVPQHVAGVLGVHEERGRTPLENLKVYLRGRQALLVLDNCEHLLEACAQLAEALLHDSPSLRMLASSREPLGVTGEAVFGVRSLPFPDAVHLPPLERLADYTAIRLFVDRARLVAPDYEVAEHNAQSLARICRRLDGIPLAIEMAAARVNMLSAAQLAERLDDAFRVLTGGSRTALPRQQTLRAMIDWSYELLSEAERRLLQRLSVFVGGCTLEAVEVVCADEAVAAPEPGAPTIGAAYVLDVLSALVSKSMVIADRDQAGEARYHLLETVRQYAREKLHAASDGDRLRGRHLRFFMQFALEAEPELCGPDQVAWLNRLGAELENLRAALEYSQLSQTSGDLEMGLRLALALELFWNIRSFQLEIFAWLEVALARPNLAARSLLRAEALRLAAWFGVPARAFDRVAEAIEIFREAGPAGRRGLAFALLTYGNLSHAQDNYGPKATTAQESIRLFRALGDKWGLAVALKNLADSLDPLVNYLPRAEPGLPAPLPSLALAARNDHTAEMAAYEESLGLFREVGDGWWQTMVLSSMGHSYLSWGARATAQAIFSELLEVQRAYVGGWLTIALRITLGRDALAHDELERAGKLFADNLAILRDRRDEFGTNLITILQVELARRRGNYAEADRLVAAVLAYYQSIDQDDFMGAIADLQGRLARSQGDHAAAHALHQRGLLRRRQAGHPINLAHSFHALALLAADRDDQAERAARLLGAARPYHAALYGFWINAPIWRAEHEQAEVAVRARLGSERAEVLWAEGEALTLEQAYALALER